VFLSFPRQLQVRLDLAVALQTLNHARPDGGSRLGEAEDHYRYVISTLAGQRLSAHCCDDTCGSGSPPKQYRLLARPGQPPLTGLPVCFLQAGHCLPGVRGTGQRSPCRAHARQRARQLRGAALRVGSACPSARPTAPGHCYSEWACTRSESCCGLARHPLVTDFLSRS
jgi:hypothetical protein